MLCLILRECPTSACRLWHELHVLGKLYAGDGGNALDAYLDNPGGFAPTRQAILSLLTANNVIRKIDAAINIITTVAGTGNIGGRNDSLAKATLRATDVEVGGDGTIYIADTGNVGLKNCRQQHRHAHTNLSCHNRKDNEQRAWTSTSIQDLKPTGIALDGTTMYIAENGKNRI